MSKPRLSVKNITKHFPGVIALKEINLDVMPGEVHVICGENGAGKSTLMKIINGIYQADSGELFFDGNRVSIQNPIQASELGISMIFQELNFIPEMTVQEFLCLGKWPKKNGVLIDWNKIKRHAMTVMKREGLAYDPQQQLKSLSVSDLQMLEIINAVSKNASLLIMDEPTSAITQKEVKKLFDKIFDLKKRGTSILYISHKMDEIFKIADRITVFRDGQVIDTRIKSEYSLEKVIHQMVGRKLENNYPPKPVCSTNTVLLNVSQLTGSKFKNIDFCVKEGEIVGFAGLMGAGRTELMRAIFGLDPYTSGQIELKGKPFTPKNTKMSIKNGLVMLSEDRRRYGVIPIRSVKENISLASLKRIIYNGHLHRELEDEYVSDYAQKMRVKTPDLATPIANLSGGNQQKAILAKWLLTEPDVFILDEPTRGIDVGAKYEIYQLMLSLAEMQKGVIMVSSELPELIGVCDRIYVMSKGNITGMIDKEAFTQEEIMKYATI